MEPINLVCGDVLQFQDQLKKMRELDDKVIYALNNSLPTASIQARSDSSPEHNCKGLFDSLKLSYNQRLMLIKDCIRITAEEVILLKGKCEKNDDTFIDQKFKLEQRKLRVFKTELSVEEIVKLRTLKTFNERCRQYYRADSF